MFRRIFGHIGNEEITKNLLTSIIPDKIQKIELDSNPITEKDLIDEKIGILDIKAKLNNNINCNIEMQIVDENNIEKRILFYWSKMYTGSIKSGDDYAKLERSIAILIADYNLENLKVIPNYMTKWNIREENYSKIILTDALEIYIIELEKAKKFVLEGNETLDSWLQFINNPKEISGMENEEIRKAKKVLEEISQDERERRLTELRQKYIMDQKAIHSHGYDKGMQAGLKQGLRKGIKQGIEQGMKQGIEQGIEQGVKQGIEQEKIKIAKKMQQENIDIQIIIDVTGLTEEEIKNI